MERTVKHFGKTSRPLKRHKYWTSRASLRRRRWVGVEREKPTPLSSACLARELAKEVDATSILLFCLSRITK